MESRRRVKAFLLLLIMVLLSLHDLIPHTHHSDFKDGTQLASIHTHDHEHQHLTGSVHDHDDQSQDEGHSLLDFLFGQHEQMSHVPQWSISVNQSALCVHLVVNAILPAIGQLFIHKQSFLHHYSLFDSGLLHQFYFLSDLSRRGPPIFH